MGDFHEIGNAMNAKDLAKQEGVTVRAINTRWNAKFPGETFDSNAVLSPVQIAELREAGKRKSVAKAKKARIVVLSKEEPGSGEAARPLSSFKWPDLNQVYRFTVSALLIAVVVCHAGLVWYDCAHLYGWAGVIGGMAVFLIVLAAVMLSANREAYGTSEAALWFVFVVDAAAWWVHFPVFQTPDVSDTVTGALCAFICGTSWVALYLFRNFNIEQ